MPSRVSGVTIAAVDVVRVGQAKTAQNRVHPDLRADGASTAEELARLEGLGARRVDVGQGADVSWTVLADPEGDEFCLLSRTVEQAASAWARCGLHDVARRGPCGHEQVHGCSGRHGRVVRLGRPRHQDPAVPPAPPRRRSRTSSPAAPTALPVLQTMVRENLRS